MAATDTVLTHVYESLKALKDGEVRPAAQALARHYGVTEQTIYRYAAKRGLRWRKQKSTAGESKVSREVLVQASALLLACRRTNSHFTLPANHAKEILEDSGIETGVSTSRFLARLREEKLSTADLARPTPHVNLLSEHPNHVWQFDVTNCLQYFLDEKKGVGERDEELELSRNKIVATAKTMRRELLRYAVVDHCTGAFYFRYFYASGERAIDGSQFLFEAMRPKDELIEKLFPGDAATKKGKYQVHGCPFILVADKGSIATAKQNEALLTSLKIELVTHLPGNPRAKGAIEGLMHHLTAFEARLKLRRPSSLDELNRWALDWCIFVNAVKKFRGLTSRSAMWSTITNEQLRRCPDEALYRLLIHEPTITRKADGSCLVRVDGRIFRVPDPEAANATVTVMRHPYEYPSIEIHANGFVWLCEPLARDRYGRVTDGVKYGEYHSPKHTTTQKAIPEIERQAEAFGLSWKGTGNHRRAEAPPVGHASGLAVFGHQAEKLPDGVEFLSREGSPPDVAEPEAIANEKRSHSAFEVPRSPAARFISIGQFLDSLRAEIGVVSPTLNKALRSVYGDRLPASETAEVIEAIRDGRWQPAGLAGCEAMNQGR